LPRYDKVVLIIPPSPWLISDRDIPMLGILYLSSYLKEHSGCEVVVCDLSSIKSMDDWYIPVGDLYGITGVSPQYIYVWNIIKKLKDREPHKPVIVGGVHATVFPDHILENTSADACVVGEGEEVLLSIVSGVEWFEIDGIRTRLFDNGMAQQMPCLDIFPFPDRSAIDYYSYLVPRTFGYMANVQREGSIITGRGCPFSCAFCASNNIYNGKVRYHSPEYVVEELVLLKEQYDVEMVNFLDDTFILNKKRVSDICDLIIKRGLNMKWFCLTRVDTIDKELLLKMKVAGCLSLAIGFESGSDRILKQMNKKVTVEQAKESIKIIASTGLLINGQLIVGFPTETKKDIELTAKFIKDCPEVDTFGLHIFQPFPGTDVWNNPEKYNIKIDKDTDFSDYHTIGKPGTIAVHDYLYLKEVIGSRSRELRIGGNDAS
jgi:anaerobic magnesium-protoporphyrin IX monomethyl ester cyclase